MSKTPTRDELNRLTAASENLGEFFSTAADEAGETRVVQVTQKLLREWAVIANDLAAALLALMPDEYPHSCAPDCKEWVFGVAIPDRTGHTDEVVCSGWPEKCLRCPHVDPDDNSKPCGMQLGTPAGSWLFAANPAWGRENWGNGPFACPYCGVRLNKQTGNGERHAAAAQDRAQAQQDRADAARVDVLERMVTESAERGEAVELDGRGGRTRVERWGPGHVYEVSAEGGSLREAIDAVVGGEVEELADRAEATDAGQDRADAARGGVDGE